MCGNSNKDQNSEKSDVSKKNKPEKIETKDSDMEGLDKKDKLSTSNAQIELDKNQGPVAEKKVRKTVNNSGGVGKSKRQKSPGKPIALPEKNYAPADERVSPTSLTVSPEITVEEQTTKEKQVNSEGEKVKEESKKVEFQIESYVYEWLSSINLVDLETDRKELEEALSELNKWQTSFHLVSDSYEDLFDGFIDILEQKKYQINKLPKFISLGFNPKSDPIHQTILRLSASLGEIAKAIEALPETERAFNRVSDLMVVLKDVNMRNSGVLDYSINVPGDFTEPVKIFMKKNLNTLVLLLKQLDRSRKMIIRELAWVLKNQMVASGELRDITPSQIGQILGKEVVVKDLLENISQHNHEVVNSTQESLDKTRKRFIKLINNTILKVTDGLWELKRNFAANIETGGFNAAEKEWLVEWSQIFQDLDEFYLGFLDSELQISEIEVKPGDPYDDNLHEPIAPSVSSNTLSPDCIYSVERRGFKLEDGFALRPTWVVTTKD